MSKPPALASVDVDWETLVSAGIEARSLGDTASWQLGDLAMQVRTHYGQGDLEKYAARISIALKTLQEYRRVSARFELSTRVDNLSWSHYRAVAASQYADQLLAEAEREGWSVAQLQEALAGLDHDAITPTLPPGVFDLIYADPPWEYEWCGLPTRRIESKYPTMAIDDIRALGVPAICADDAILFLWTPPALTEAAISVVNAWGFSYRTCMTWDKETMGLGLYVRQMHELLLIGRRGNFHLPSVEARPPSVVRHKRQGHSVKPALFAEIIETMYPDATRVELFARRVRPGWTAWGNEIPAVAPQEVA